MGNIKTDGHTLRTAQGRWHTRVIGKKIIDWLTHSVQCQTAEQVVQQVDHMTAIIEYAFVIKPCNSANGTPVSAGYFFPQATNIRRPAPTMIDRQRDLLRFAALYPMAGLRKGRCDRFFAKN